ncbi:phosphoribosyltransferase [Croceivirga sp. JEA036]|uniref:phosphoribosyltransferase n=1 Tax=Croceivirga sp. JEA036 TaxID=2721162 RepID=UPI00143950F6|nr:phosphoribosyltransferase [Croceivirga sp. JEA036]NJB38118.1 phosphoribosyltransferase [Croceivirga sp. JEA036]
MAIQRIKLAHIDYKSSLQGSYDKTFGKTKDRLRLKRFPEPDTTDFIKERMVPKLLERVQRTLTKDTILVCMPRKEGKLAPNVLPIKYTKLLSDIHNIPHIDLSDYLRVIQERSARGSYSAGERADNPFRISFNDTDTKQELLDKLSNKKILLVDDVITTGETSVVMATFLKETVPNIEIQGAHALAVVNNSGPTPRDIMRITEKLNAHLPKIDPNRIREDVHLALGSFTRKKAMRFEIGIKDLATAIMKYYDIKKDISKIQNGLGTSISEPVANKRANGINQLKETSTTYKHRRH